MTDVVEGSLTGCHPQGWHLECSCSGGLLERLFFPSNMEPALILTAAGGAASQYWTIPSTGIDTEVAVTVNGYASHQ